MIGRFAVMVRRRGIHNRRCRSRRLGRGRRFRRHRRLAGGRGRCCRRTRCALCTRRRPCGGTANATVLGHRRGRCRTCRIIGRLVRCECSLRGGYDAHYRARTLLGRYGRGRCRRHSECGFPILYRSASRKEKQQANPNQYRKQSRHKKHRPLPIPRQWRCHRFLLLERSHTIQAKPRVILDLCFAERAVLHTLSQRFQVIFKQ